jgi:hypothetical protein
MILGAAIELRNRQMVNCRSAPLSRIPADSSPRQPVRIFNIVARTTQHQRKNLHAQTLARQVMSIIRDPPPAVKRDFGNVSLVVITLEITPNWHSPGEDRLAFRRLCDDWETRIGYDADLNNSDVFAAVNPSVLSRRSRISTRISTCRSGSRV